MAQTGSAAAEDSLTAALVIDFISSLMKAIRGTQTYNPNNPVYQRLLGNFQSSTTALWPHAGALHLTVEEGGLRWRDKLFPAGEGRETLSFLFFRDGIRQLTFLPGFEDEVDRFIALILKARAVSREGDDLLTLLWTEEFTGFQYAYVDVLAESVELPEPPADPQLRAGGVSLDELREEVAAAAEESRTTPARQAEPPDLASLVARDEQEETLHFLSQQERQLLETEVELEWTRDLKTDVLNALFDRLEDPLPERQAEILGILEQLLPVLLSRGDIASATMIVRELQNAATRKGFSETLAREIDQLFDQLSDPQVLGQLIRLLEEGIIGPETDELYLYFGHLRAAALPLLIRAAEQSRVEGVRRRLQSALDGLARQHQQALVSLLEATDETIQLGAVRLAGRLQLAEAAPALGRLLETGGPAIRQLVVDALVRVPSGSAAASLQRLLEDADREVRISAARALGSLRYEPARAAFEAVIDGRTLRDADLTEKIAFFEAYGALAGPEGVAVLDRILNGKGLLGRRPAAEYRACAAVALGVIGSPAARASLERAASDADAVVRTAVSRALRQEMQKT